ncbi:hypothetical protein C0995_014603 [Termitomyces sp. Mi166|nr:hypothetical protein C0995_014603 [Termitomyces sp. Mi166\
MSTSAIRPSSRPTAWKAAAAAAPPGTKTFAAELPKLPVANLPDTLACLKQSLAPIAWSDEEYAAVSKKIDQFAAGQGPELQQRLLSRAEETRHWLEEWWDDGGYLGYRDSPPHLPPTPAARAAGLARAAMIFRQNLKKGLMEPDSTKEGPLCMDTYRQIRYIYENSNGAYPGVGVLTASNRDVWAKDYGTLASSAQNTKILTAIQSAAFVISLEPYSPSTSEEHSRALWYGSVIDGAPTGLRTRWVDKPIEFIVYDNAVAGLMGEHSVMDGTPTVRLCDDVLNMLADPTFDHGSPTIPSTRTPTPLDWEITPAITEAITKADAAAMELIESQELGYLLTPYGKAAIKKFGVSPDSWAQMIVQLAYRRLIGSNKRVGGTYEAATTRRFDKGRTEAIRVVTRESDTWAASMDNPDIGNEERKRLFSMATKKHVELAKSAGNGQGIDRHLFGLKKVLKEGEKVPELFSDPVFLRSSYWTLSTSAIFSKHFPVYGWGEVVPDGFGVAYMTGYDDRLQYTITSRKEMPNTKFCKEIAKAAADLIMSSSQLHPKDIKNKMKREEVARKNKKAKNQQKLERRLARAKAEADDPAAKKAKNVPRTLDNMREFDPSILTADPNQAGPSSSQDALDEAVEDIANDPFASYFTSTDDPSIPPKILITTSSKASKSTYEFCDELVGVFPGAEFIQRKKGKGFEMGRIAGWAAGRDYKHLLVVNEDMKKPNAITLVYLPNGPTAYFKLTSIELTKNIFGHARATPHHPELVLNGFVTRLGHTVGRIFQTMFPPLPEFQGRQVVTLHNQRDFLFFRRHRYAFRSTEKVALQEIGPRFTLKLRSLRKGLPAVLNYGEAPKPLEFDVGPFEETEEKADQESVLPFADGAPDSSDAKPRKPVLPPNTDEYLWQWKAGVLRFPPVPTNHDH